MRDFLSGAAASFAVWLVLDLTGTLTTAQIYVLPLLLGGVWLVGYRRGLRQGLTGGRRVITIPDDTPPEVVTEILLAMTKDRPPGGGSGS
jgi:hypothetical protein